MMDSVTHHIRAKSHILSLLGDELIGNDSLAIFELVKNSYDADAEEVHVEFIDLNTPQQKIIISDNGHGMTPEIIETVWLTIGTDFKRGKNRKVSPKLARVSLGNKGVGRFAVHKLAKRITVETQTVETDFFSRVVIDWPKLISSKEFIQDLEVSVEKVNSNLFKNGRLHGTQIILEELSTEVWTKKAIMDLVRMINGIKNPFNLSFHSNYTDKFSIIFSANNPIYQSWINDVKDGTYILENSLYTYKFKISKSDSHSGDFAIFEWDYEFSPPNIKNLSKKTLKNLTQEASKEPIPFHIGDLFKKLFGSENRHLLNHDLDDVGSISGIFHVFNQNSEVLKSSFGGQILAVKEYIKENAGIRVFRDGIRVFNYGEQSDDWLGLDLDKIQRTGDHFGKKVTIGAIELDLKSSFEGLIEKTNREGFIENASFVKLRAIVKEVFNSFERIADKDKESLEIALSGNKPIRKIGFGETLSELRLKLDQKNLTKELKPFIERLDKDYNGMRDVMLNSGLTGLNLGIAFHEVEREIRFINSDLSSKNFDINLVKDKVKNLIQILESLSPLLRQNIYKNTSALDLVAIARNRNTNRFSYHKMIFSSPLLSKENMDFKMRVPVNLVLSAISNIIDNSIYWTKSKSQLVQNSNTDYKPALYIGTDLNTFDGNAIIIADNGPGFNIEPELLTQPFKTSKESGMGLGLYFADLVMNMVGGSLLFPDNEDLDIPKAYNGACLVLVFPKKL